MNDHADLDTRGKRLREDIRELYASMKRNKTLRTGVIGNDVSNFMRTYLHEGISFDDAEQILRSAGFKVYGRPDINAPDDPNWPGRSDRYDVIATLGLPSGMFSGAELMMGLRPRSPGDYTTVNEIRAAITVIFL